MSRESLSPYFSLVGAVRYLWLMAFLAAGLLPVGCKRAKVAVDTTPLGVAERTVQEASKNEKTKAAAEVGYQLLNQGYIEEAQAYLTDAAQVIESVYADDAHAKKASSLWHGESKKVFRGEPYERAMTYFHLAFTYLVQGDYENARNLYRSAAFQDSFAAEDQNTTDFHLMHFLEAWADVKLDASASDAEEIIGRIGDHHASLILPKPKHNALILCETGIRPKKFAEGQYNEFLAFAAEPDPIWAIEMTAGGESYYIYDGANVFYQAVTRGGRFVDHLNRRKARYKKSAKVSANVAWTVGVIALSAAAVAATQRDGEEAAAVLFAVGVGAMVVGGTFYVVAALITPNADTRMQESLPNRIYARSMKIPDQAQDLVFRYYGQYMNEIGSSRRVALPADRSKNLTLYLTRDGVVKNW